MSYMNRRKFLGTLTAGTAGVIAATKLPKKVVDEVVEIAKVRDETGVPVFPEELVRPEEPDNTQFRQYYMCSTTTAVDYGTFKVQDPVYFDRSSTYYNTPFVETEPLKPGSFVKFTKGGKIRPCNRNDTYMTHDGVAMKQTAEDSKAWWVKI